MENVTTDQLYSWSAPIDLIEDYEIYSSTNDSSSKVIYYNCTPPWFGPLCQYSLILNQKFQSFADIVEIIFAKESREAYSSSPSSVIFTNLSCYMHLPCNRGGSFPACLDWREICDGKIDCLNGGVDEEHCDQLEINECKDNEYRCHNGQCIPENFLRDNIFNPDCLDGTDEFVHEKYPMLCAFDPTFRCENIKCRPSVAENLECGDGQCALTECHNKRDILLKKAMIESTLNVSKECRNAMVCLTGLDDCTPKVKINKHCPDLFQFPEVPALFGHVKFFYSNNLTVSNSSKYMLPKYVCHDIRLCPALSPNETSDNYSSCQLSDRLPLPFHLIDSWNSLILILKIIYHTCSVVSGGYCHHNQTLYQCKSSLKCISKHRLIDGISDCFLDDDEQYPNSCLLSKSKHRFSCDNKCLSPILMQNNRADCSNSADEYPLDSKKIHEHILFQTICDGFTELNPPQFIDGENYTDETECDLWLCNNTYTRCNGIWNCKKGEDEVNCPPSPCPPFEHMCVSPVNSSLFCLPIERAGDGIVDCLGASDERQLCRTWEPDLAFPRFWCRNDTKCIYNVYLCDSTLDCIHGDDEQHCPARQHSCSSSFLLKLEGQVLCNLSDIHKLDFIPLSMQNSRVYPRKFQISNKKSRSDLIEHSLVVQEENETISRSILLPWVWSCNRGIGVAFWSGVGNSELRCLCPPSYYGNLCQYQNQRVSVTVRVNASFNWRTVSGLVLTLIDDDEHFINSYYQVDYLPFSGCGTKFNMYLLYATRPKNSSKNYSVQIDAFFRHSLKYHTSWLFPVQFSFLPVYRMTLEIIIPTQPMKSCSLDCGIHGQCLKYYNTEKYFCRCNYGWSGSKCNNQDICDCSSDSHCIGPSICLCPLNKFGSRCYLKRSLCTPNPCLNDGICFSSDVAHSKDKIFCICLETFSGETCQFRNTRIDIIFRGVTVPSSIFVHFIEVYNDEQSHIRTTTLKKIGIYEDSLTIYRIPPFHILFTEFNDNYYLTVSQEQYTPSMNISTDIIPSHRCLSINELFNETVSNWHLIRRIKYYHLPCQQRADLACFYDDTQMCLCNSYQQANCFEFDHNMTYKCLDTTYCENSIECFQDDPYCPTKAVCLCLECYYGSRCQFPTKGIGLSLDAIIGYHIRPNIDLINQPLITKVSTTVTMVITIVGTLDSFLAIITFQRKHVLDIGCGIYLLMSSIASLLTMTMFALKFWLLLYAQMGTIVNRSFLQFNCISIDYFLRVFVTITDWLNACVAVERAITVMKGVSFDKLKSKRATKWVIMCIVLFTTSTSIQDPIHRGLIDDEEEQRTWCLTKYSKSIQFYNSAVIYFHFLAPFIINIISLLAIIILTARRRSKAQKQLSYGQHLRQQFQQHKHLLISSCILVILALPRLIISSLSSCIKSIRDPWLFLIGYFVSFIPPALTFVVFILPSNTYKKEFKEAIKCIRQKFRQT